MPSRQAIKNKFEALDIIPEVKEKILKRLAIYSDELSEAQLADFESFVEELAVKEEKIATLLDDYIQRVETAEAVDDFKMEQTLDIISQKTEALQAKAQAAKTA